MSQSNQLVQYTNFHNFNSLIKQLNLPSYMFCFTLSFLHTPSYTFKCLFILSFLTCILTLAFIHSPYYIYSFSHAFSHLHSFPLYPYLQFLFTQLLSLILAFIKFPFFIGFHTHIFTIIFLHFHLPSYTSTDINKPIPSFLHLK